VIETDPATLFCIASREFSIKESIDAGTLKIQGKRTDAERFLSSFSFEDRSRELEHV
jgi:hypothetical protein